MDSPGNQEIVNWQLPDRLWSLWDMLKSYFPIYKIALALEARRSKADALRGTSEVSKYETNDFQEFVGQFHQTCSDFGFTFAADMAKRILDRPPPEPFITP